MYNNPLLDKEFLAKLDSIREREVYARIIALTFQENPIESIEGRVTNGSVSVDGTSTVRRACSLTLVANDLNINDFYWGVKSKFKLEVGLKNTIDEKYPDIIWFPQGIFVITAFNTTYSTTSYTISISGKDKMCMLNGDIGGNLPASIDFGVEEYTDLTNNTVTYTSIPIKTILKDSIHTYAGEPYHNIVINDIEDSGLELLEYRGDTAIYLFRDVEKDIFTNFTLDGEKMCYHDGTSYALKNLQDFQLDTRVRIDSNTTQEDYIVTLSGDSTTQYTIAKLSYGDTAGYRITDLTYAGDLISKLGDSLTSILDKIKTMLGEFEYFYDINGKFIFQRKKNYVNQTWNNTIKTGDESYTDNAAYSSQITYYFEDNNLITSFQNTPTLSNLKNDFSIWGARTSISGASIPVHYRYAIDKKPYSYTSVTISSEDVKTYNDNHSDSQIKAQTSTTYTTDSYDWRELIYQMAVDYRAYNQLDDFIKRVAEANVGRGQFGEDLYSTGYTGYEQYYVDVISFWRELYGPEFSKDGTKHEWNSDVTSAPDTLNFWFDFLDSESGELSQFSVPIVGDRSKTVNDSSVTSIYFKEVPDLIFASEAEYNSADFSDKTGYTQVNTTSNLESLFSISSQGKSAKDVLDEYLYNYSYCTESITIQAIPIYHLQPNTRIFVSDSVSKINGEYIISKMTIPLTYNGTMSITATKAPERIY